MFCERAFTFGYPTDFIEIYTNNDNVTPKSWTQIPPPTINGPPVFEKVVRVQQGTQEQFTLLLPLLWIFGVFVSQLVRVLLSSRRSWRSVSLLAGPSPDGERYLVQVACVVALVWIFSRALFSGLHAQEKPTKSDEHYALWAEKYSRTLLFSSCPHN